MDLLRHKKTAPHSAHSIRPTRPSSGESFATFGILGHRFSCERHFRDLQCVTSDGADASEFSRELSFRRQEVTGVHSGAEYVVFFRHFCRVMEHAPDIDAFGEIWSNFHEFCTGKSRGRLAERTPFRVGGFDRICGSRPLLCRFNHLAAFTPHFRTERILRLVWLNTVHVNHLKVHVRRSEIRPIRFQRWRPTLKIWLRPVHFIGGQ